MDAEPAKTTWTAREKREEQLKNWNNSDTDVQSNILKNTTPKVKFDEGAVFLAACSSGDLKEVDFLLKTGSDINCANVDGLTALHQACIDEKLDVVQFLVNKGIVVDQQDNEGWTPLHAAASCGFLDIARFLVRNGANVAAVNSEGEIPADIADDDEMREYLEKEVVRQGLDIAQAKNHERQVMLDDAQHLVDCVNSGERIRGHRHPKSGATALHVAAAKGYNEVLKLLIQVGLDVNTRDHDHWTPLHAASHWGHEQAAKILADRGADFQAKSRLGQTPSDVADDEMIKYMDRLSIQQKLLNNDKKDVITRSSGYDRDLKPKFKVSSMDADEDDSMSSESEEDDDSSTSSASDVVSINPTSITTPAKSNISSLASSASGGNLSTPSASSFSTRRHVRPASIHVTSPGQIKVEGFDSSSASVRRTAVAGGITDKPTVAVQPNERSSSSHLKDDSPATWRSGLRKTGSFEDKKQTAPRVTASTTNASSSSSTHHHHHLHSGEGDRSKRQTDVIKDGSSSTAAGRTARVTPLLDTRTYPRNKYDNLTTSATPSSIGGRKTNLSTSNIAAAADKSAASTSPRYLRHYGMLSRSPVASSSSAASSMRRMNNSTSSLSLLVNRVGRKEDDDDDSDRLYRSRSTSLLSSQLTTNTSTDDLKNEETSLTSLSNLSDQKQDKRRSHLQPVRDEEAEAQRKARSRRERQARRSTQGVTLDVYEEAKRHIKKVRKERDENPSNIRTSQAYDSTTATSYDHDSKNSNGSLGRRGHGDVSGSGSGISGSQQSSSSASVSLPASYVPQDKRIRDDNKTTTTTTTTTSSLLHQQDKQDESADDDGAKSTNLSSSSSARKQSLQQSRRRPRNQRRSTGIDNNDEGKKDLVWLKGLKKVKSQLLCVNERRRSNISSRIANRCQQSFKSPSEYYPTRAQKMKSIEDRKSENYDNDSTIHQPNRLTTTTSNFDRDRASSFSKRSTEHRSTAEPSAYEPRVHRYRSDPVDDKDYKKLYTEQSGDVDRLKDELKGARLLIIELERKIQMREDQQRRNGDHEKVRLASKLAEMEKQLADQQQQQHDLLTDNQRLKDENGALIRVISKLSK